MMISPRLRRLAFAAIILSVCPITQAQTNVPPAIPAPPPATPSLPPGVSEVVFGQGGGRDLHALIASPPDAKGPLPAILWIHGGGWSGGNYKDGIGLMRGIVQHGYFAATIEYRLDGEAKWPAQIEDCKCAVRWLRANAAKYNVDPNRIGVWGGSAGGHLVACLGTMGDVKEYEGTGGWAGTSSAVQAVCDFFGPADLTDEKNFYSADQKKVVERLIGFSHEANPAAWKSASPDQYVKAGDPPVLIVQGDSDTTVPLVQSTLFDDALTKAGVPHQLIVVKNAGHGFGAKPGTTISPGRSDIDKAVFEFFDKYLKAPASPSPSP